MLNIPIRVFVVKYFFILFQIFICSFIHTKKEQLQLFLKSLLHCLINKNLLMRYRITAGPRLLHVMTAVMSLAVTVFSMMLAVMAFSMLMLAVVLTVMALSMLMLPMMSAMVALSMSMLTVVSAVMAFALSVFSVMLAVGIWIKLKCTRHKSFNSLVSLSAHAAIKHDTGLP